MTEAETAVRKALTKMTPGLKADPYGPPGRYTMDAEGCIVIRTESPNDQAALIAFQQHTPALLAELDAARAEVVRLKTIIKANNDLTYKLASERDGLRASEARLRKALAEADEAAGTPIAGLLARVRALEENSHPPVDIAEVCEAVITKMVCPSALIGTRAALEAGHDPR